MQQIFLHTVWFFKALDDYIIISFLYSVLCNKEQIRSGTGDLWFRIPRGKGFFGKCCLLKDNNSNNMKRDVETLMLRGNFDRLQRVSHSFIN